MTRTVWNYLAGNAYHEAGHAIVGWALRRRVIGITIRDNRPGENAKIAGAKRLSLIEQIALLNAGRQAEEVFRHLLPSWASNCDRVQTIKLLTANEIREPLDISTWTSKGRARAQAPVEARAASARAGAAPDEAPPHDVRRIQALHCSHQMN
jgi:hypothetical protein